MMKVLITAGPTHEPIDPVRFIGNRSSGKMGIAIAEAFANSGALVELVLGPTHLVAQHKNITTTRVETALEMHEACLQLFSRMNVAILSAAVADYRVLNSADQKIKKKEDKLTLELVKNPDILKDLGELKQDHQYLCGFALETENLLENAKGKLVKKNLDCIVANSPSADGSGFGYDTNRAFIIKRSGDVFPFDLKTKVELAQDIYSFISEELKSRQTLVTLSQSC